MKRKILSLLLAALMLCSVLPIMASAKQTSFIKNEILDSDAYYHLQYTEEQKLFSSSINLYTALGFYDRAWYNYFTDEVDIDYATSILLALIERVDVAYENEDFEKFIKVLDGASSVADVIDKVNEYTGIMDFAESNEWATSISVLNNIIKIANYSNEMYEAFIDGYASILSARAASIYYSDLLQTLVDNCENKAVQDAAAAILESINSELEAAVKKLVEELVYSAGQDAVSIGVDLAMSSNTVTAAIKSVYGTGNGLADKLFKTSSKYGYMCSLAEIYYIEDCLLPWAEEKLALGDDGISTKSFALNAMLTLRESGEELLSGLAATTDKTLTALTKSYDVTEIKVKTAMAVAKLGVMREILNSDSEDEYIAILTATSDADAIVRSKGEIIAHIDGDAEVAAVNSSIGYTANVYSELLDTFVKVVVLKASGAYESVSIYNPNKSVISYMQFDSVASGARTTAYATLALKDGRSFITEDVTAVASPVINISQDNYTSKTAFTDTFSKNAAIIVFESADNTQIVDKPSFGEKFKAFFVDIGAFFVKLFNIFK